MSLSGISVYSRRPVPDTVQELPNYLSTELLLVQRAIPVANSRTVTAAYAVIPTDDLILANATSGTFAVTLPDPTRVANLKITIKKIDASVNAVTITVTGGTTIDGGASSLTAQWNVKQYQSDGVLWYILSAS